tara:strand:+ start:19021 stop:19746 length:726 start_codon:yes stop_codon:yes gene_type:complete
MGKTNDFVSGARALEYPFEIPDCSYVFESGNCDPLLSDNFETVDRIPVLAAGSNQSPEQLSRKYANSPGLGPIPVIHGRLWDFDVVYAAHLAGYGSVPATFQNSPGTIVDVFLAWFTEAQLLRMHQTEGNYTFDRLMGCQLEVDFGRSPCEIFAYTAKSGCYNHMGNCLSLSEINASERSFPSASQREIQAILCKRFSPKLDVENFIVENITNKVIKANRLKKMRENSIAIYYSRETLISL